MKQVLVPDSLIKRAVECLARAEDMGAFKNCVAPNVGKATLTALESILNEGK